MSEQETQTKKVWVGGVVNRDPKIPKGTPNADRYTFFEIDTPDLRTHEFVLKIYQNFGINVCSIRCGQGYHYFGDVVNIQTWREWYEVLKPLNEKYPPLTLRITKKRENEVWEKSIYHNFKSEMPNWAKAICHFLNKELRHENDTWIKTAMERCGLSKYWRCVTYQVEIPI